jgi:hypothetical protein
MDREEKVPKSEQPWEPEVYFRQFCPLRFFSFDKGENEENRILDIFLDKIQLAMLFFFFI